MSTFATFPTSEELKALSVAAKKFAEDNLKECCEELIEYSSTAILREGKVRELARMYGYAGYHSLALAQSAVETAAVNRAVECLS